MGSALAGLKPAAGFEHAGDIANLHGESPRRSDRPVSVLRDGAHRRRNCASGHGASRAARRPSRSAVTSAALKRTATTAMYQFPMKLPEPISQGQREPELVAKHCRTVAFVLVVAPVFRGRLSVLLMRPATSVGIGFVAVLVRCGLVHGATSPMASARITRRAQPPRTARLRGQQRRSCRGPRSADTWRGPRARCSTPCWSFRQQGK